MARKRRGIEAWCTGGVWEGAWSHPSPLAGPLRCTKPQYSSPSPSRISPPACPPPSSLALLCMSLYNNVLLATTVLATACTTPLDSGGFTPPASQLSLRAGTLDVSGKEIYLVAYDSLILRATVGGDPDAYQAPMITATNASALINRADGSALVRIPAFLDLTATAVPKANVGGRAVLTTTAKLHLACTAEGRAAVSVTLRDFTTGTAPTGPGTVRIRVTAAGFVDSISGPIGAIQWPAAIERVGTYAVDVDADGYLPWRQDSIVVTKGLCHIFGQSVTAVLIRR